MKKIILTVLFLLVCFSLTANRSNMSRLARESAIKTNLTVISFDEWKNEYHSHRMYRKYGGLK